MKRHLYSGFPNKPYASRLLEGRVMNSIPLWKEKLMPLYV